jgi:hypothetical protein
MMGCSLSPLVSLLSHPGIRAMRRCIARSRRFLSRRPRYPARPPLRIRLPISHLRCPRDTRINSRIRSMGISRACLNHIIPFRCENQKNCFSFLLRFFFLFSARPALVQSYCTSGPLVRPHILFDSLIISLDSHLCIKFIFPQFRDLYSIVPIPQPNPQTSFRSSFVFVFFVFSNLLHFVSLTSFLFSNISYLFLNLVHALRRIPAHYFFLIL